MDRRCGELYDIASLYKSSDLKDLPGLPLISLYQHSYLSSFEKATEALQSFALGVVTTGKSNPPC